MYTLKNKYNMKSFKSILLLLFLSAYAIAADKKTDTIRIKTSAICDECKERIESTLAYEKGIVKSDLDVKTKVVTVIYKTDKTSPALIRKAISEAGYDADDIKANSRSYEKLPKCCKKQPSGLKSSIITPDF